MLLVMPPAIALGRVFATRAFPGKAFAETLLLLPLVLPPVVTGYGLLVLRP
jgi:molybdate transport system permease protein